MDGSVRKVRRYLIALLEALAIAAVASSPVWLWLWNMPAPR